MVLGLLVLVGCGDDDGGATARPGSPAVYAEIATETDCAALQTTFDRAAANNDRAAPGSAEHQWTLGYMRAADDRMKTIGCHG
jgi:hypothetical protein